MTRKVLSLSLKKPSHRPLSRLILPVFRKSASIVEWFSTRRIRLSTMNRASDHSIGAELLGAQPLVLARFILSCSFDGCLKIEVVEVERQRFPDDYAAPASKMPGSCIYRAIEFVADDNVPGHYGGKPLPK
jgi:hypothetical protein